MQLVLIKLTLIWYLVIKLSSFGVRVLGKATEFFFVKS
ncbi:hypothetical protein Patl1_26987 [Pistacia atlantica]|uniref:Uncharacterized protein n=1 Tax=Pistacia atlantica TaxID=434234 RepID=A0ACC1B4A6_9ROSI|nr:hypothetical protein Patl1_26987 [Pistacia atlantica]